jgi:hypothetical protein
VSYRAVKVPAGIGCRESGGRSRDPPRAIEGEQRPASHAGAPRQWMLSLPSREGMRYQRSEAASAVPHPTGIAVPAPAGVAGPAPSRIVLPPASGIISELARRLAHDGMPVIDRTLLAGDVSGGQTRHGDKKGGRRCRRRQQNSTHGYAPHSLAAPRSIGRREAKLADVDRAATNYLPTG